MFTIKVTTASGKEVIESGYGIQWTPYAYKLDYTDHNNCGDILTLQPGDKAEIINSAGHTVARYVNDIKLQDALISITRPGSAL